MKTACYRPCNPFMRAFVTTMLDTCCRPAELSTSRHFVISNSNEIAAVFDLRRGTCWSQPLRERAAFDRDILSNDHFTLRHGDGDCAGLVRNLGKPVDNTLTARDWG